MSRILNDLRTRADAADNALVTEVLSGDRPPTLVPNPVPPARACWKQSAPSIWA